MPIWSTNMYSTSSQYCYGSSNSCPATWISSCVHSEDVTVECSKSLILFNDNNYTHVSLQLFLF